MMKRALPVFFLLALTAVSHPAAAPQQQASGDDWCRNEWSGNRDRETVCDVRQFKVAAAGTLSVNAEPNGGMSLRPLLSTVTTESCVSFDVRGAPPCVPPFPFSPWQTTHVVV